MVITYINYPNSRFVIHSKADCDAFRQHSKKNQRIVKISVSNISEELMKFEKRYKFCPMAKYNDMWIQVDLDDQRYEEETILHIHKILSNRYRRLRNITYCNNCSQNIND